MPSTIQAGDVILYLREATDADSAKKQVMCITDFTVSETADTTETDTLHCGTLVGIQSPKWTASFNAVFDSAIEADEVSAKELKAWMRSKTKLTFSIAEPTSGTVGEDYYDTGSCYVSKCDLTGTAKDIVKYSVSITGDGELSSTLPS